MLPPRGSVAPADPRVNSPVAMVSAIMLGARCEVRSAGAHAPAGNWMNEHKFFFTHVHQPPPLFLSSPLFYRFTRLGRLGRAARAFSALTEGSSSTVGVGGGPAFFVVAGAAFFAVFSPAAAWAGFASPPFAFLPRSRPPAGAPAAATSSSLTGPGPATGSSSSPSSSPSLGRSGSLIASSSPAATALRAAASFLPARWATTAPGLALTRWQVYEQKRRPGKLREGMSREAGVVDARRAARAAASAERRWKRAPLKGEGEQWDGERELRFE